MLRDQAAQALGEAIAVFDDSHQSPDLEGTLANAMHDTSGQSRWYLARALGELHAAVDRPNTAPNPIEALIDEAIGGDEIEWSATVAIGAIAMVDPDGTDFVSTVPDDLIAAVDPTGKSDYRAALEAVGSVALGIGDMFVTKAVTDALESSTREKRAELLPIIAETEVFSPDEFLQLLADADPTDSGQEFRTYFDSEIRDHVVSALQAVSRQAGASLNMDLRRSLESNLSSEEAHTLDPATRLAMVDCLVACPTANADRSYDITTR